LLGGGGVDGYPKQEAAEIALKTVTDFLSKHHENEKVIFCCFDEENYQIMNQLATKN